MNQRTVACECNTILPGIQSYNCDIWNYRRICMKCPLCTYQVPTTTTTTTLTQKIMHLVKRSAIKGQFKNLGKDWMKVIKVTNIQCAFIAVLLFNDFTIKLCMVYP